MSESVTLKSYFYEVLIPSSQKNTSSPIEDILHHVSISFMKKLALYKCFNPRTHTGCDTTIRRPPRWSVGFNPRTHTGCDESLSFEPINFHVSIHAPTRGATPSPGPWTASGPSFNPRTHTGCDGLTLHYVVELVVSIHAPTRGATSPTLPNNIASLVSIHAPTRGATSYGLGSLSPRLFQSTHPHGVRRGTDKKILCGYVSIHAPTRGATS